MKRNFFKLMGEKIFIDDERKPDNHDEKAMNQESDDDRDVDTTLRLSISINADQVADTSDDDDHHHINQTTSAINLSKFAKEVDKNFLSLSINHDHHQDHQDQSKDLDDHDHPPIVLNPKPLRCYPPTEDDMDEWLANSASFEPATYVASTSHNVDNTQDDKTSPPRKRKLIDDIHAKKVKRSKVEMELNPAAPIPPQLLETIGPNPPVFLYGKKLKESDTKKDQNRLFVTESEKLMEFMTEDERRAVGNGRGVDVIGIDALGREYDLHVTWWASLNMIVLNKKWFKLVVQNQARRGDLVDVWGFRRDGKLCLLVIFTHLYEQDHENNKKKNKSDEDQDDNKKKKNKKKNKSDEELVEKKKMKKSDDQEDENKKKKSDEEDEKKSDIEASTKKNVSGEDHMDDID